MAKSKKEAEKKTSGQPNAVTRYFRETRGEIRKVTWPTREESIRLTAIVIGVSLVTAIFLWAMDFIFSSGIQLIIQNIIGL